MAHVNYIVCLAFDIRFFPTSLQPYIRKRKNLPPHITLARFSRESETTAVMDGNIYQLLDSGKLFEIKVSSVRPVHQDGPSHTEFAVTLGLDPPEELLKLYIRVLRYFGARKSAYPLHLAVETGLTEEMANQLFQQLKLIFERFLLPVNQISVFKREVGASDWSLFSYIPLESLGHPTK